MYSSATHLVWLLPCLSLAHLVPGSNSSYDMGVSTDKVVPVRGKDDCPLIVPSKKVIKFSSDCMFL